MITSICQTRTPITGTTSRLGNPRGGGIPRVAMVIGSKSCWKYMGEAVELLKRFGVEVEVGFCLLIIEPPEP